jgi:hypothetical protein
VQSFHDPTPVPVAFELPHLDQWMFFTMEFASAHERTSVDGATLEVVEQSKIATVLIFDWWYEKIAKEPDATASTISMRKGIDRRTSE